MNIGQFIEMRGELKVDYIPQSGSLLAVHGEEKHYNLIQELLSYNGQNVKITIERLP
jgi:hypothetical protein